MRRPLFPVVISILLLLVSLVTAVAQAPQSHAQYFSGFVTEITAGSLSVSRKNGSGKEMVNKSFTTDAQTKVEGKIKVNARVTVQFTVDADSNRALRIIVRGN